MGVSEARNEREVAMLDDSDCVEWGQDEVLSQTEEVSSEDRGGLCMAVTTVLISVPSLVGGWCWPILLAGLFSAAGQGGADWLGPFSHSIGWGINLAIFTNLLQFMGRKAAAKAKGTYRQRWGPFWCVFFGMLGVMAEATRLILTDCFKILPMHILRPDGTPIESEYSIYGIIFTFGCTWTGSLLLMIGILWETDMIGKIRKTFRKARRPRPQPELPAWVERGPSARPSGSTAGGSYVPPTPN